MYTIHIIKDKCIGCGYCVESASDIYIINQENGKAFFVNQKYAISLHMTDEEFTFHDLVRKVCPVMAIKTIVEKK